MERELNIIAKMQFIEDNKEILKDHILARVDNENVAFLILNMLLDNKTLLETIEYEKLVEFIKEKQAVEERGFIKVCDVIGIIKSYISKIYHGNNNENIVIQKINECEKIFSSYKERKNNNKVKSLKSVVS